MTNEQTQELINTARQYVAFLESVRSGRGFLYEREEHKMALVKIALAALTAPQPEPVDFRWRWARDENAVWTYCHMDKYQYAVNAFGANATFELVYSTPPAPVMQPVKLSGGSLRPDGRFWYPADKVIQLIRVAGYPVEE